MVQSGVPMVPVVYAAQMPPMHQGMPAAVAPPPRADGKLPDGSGREHGGEGGE